jgi:flagellar biosynthesis protein FlhG
MGIEDYLQSARYRRRLALDYRFLFPNLMDPDELALANLTREQLESAYEIRLHQIETYNGKDRKAAEEQRSRLNASLQHLIAFADERDAMVRRIGADPLATEETPDHSEFKSVFLTNHRRVRLVAVGGGKGGIGKSLVAANLAIALATMGKTVVAIDMDLGGADLHLALGLRSLPRSLNDFLERKYENLEEVRLQTAYRNLSIIATDSSRLGVANIKHAHKEKVLRHLAKLDCDIVIADLGAEVSFNVLDIFLAADHRYVVTSTEPTSVLEAYGLVKLSLFRKIRHFAGELIPPSSPLGEQMADFLFEREDGETNGKPHTVWQLVDLIAQTDPEVHRKLLKMIWNYHVDLVINMSDREKDWAIAQTMTRLCQDNLAINVEHSYLVPWDQRVRDCARLLLPVVIQASSSAASRALIQMATEAAFLGGSKEEIGKKINAIAPAVKERVKKMSEMSALGRPGQPVDKIVSLAEQDKPSRLREFLAKEIHLRRQ